MKPAARRKEVRHLQGCYAVSKRRACGLVDMGTSSFYYKEKERDDGALRAALKEAAAKRKRWGYRMLTVLLRRQGFVDNHKRIYRVYREESLQVPVRRKRKAARWRGEAPAPTSWRNDRWSMDFTSDQLSCGRKIRTFNVIDDHTRECLAIEVDTSIGGGRVCRVLDRLVAERGHPKRILSDNGPEFTGKALDRWCYEHRVEHEFIQPGKPVQNAFVESFNGTFRNECLNENWFTGLADARRIAEAWRVDYNEVRPHSSLDDRTPGEFGGRLAATLRPSAPLQTSAPPPGGEPHSDPPKLENEPIPERGHSH